MKISCSQKSLFLLGLAAMTDFAFCGEAGVKSLEPIAQAMEFSEPRKEVVEMHKDYIKCVNAQEITAQSGKTKGANAGQKLDLAPLIILLMAQQSGGLVSVEGKQVSKNMEKREGSMLEEMKSMSKKSTTLDEKQN
jgi:hypothetical protein